MSHFSWSGENTLCGNGSLLLNETFAPAVTPVHVARRPLAVIHGTANLFVLGRVLEIDDALFAALAGVALIVTVRLPLAPGAADAAELAVVADESTLCFSAELPCAAGALSAV